MKKELVGILVAGILMILGGCVGNSNNFESAPEPEPVSYYADIYISVLDSYFEPDNVLQDRMEYIAIDMDTLEHATDGDKIAISDYFCNKYSVEIMDASFNDLKKQHMVGKGNSLEGILISVESVIDDDGLITIKGSKFRSGLGAEGFESTLTNVDGVWELQETKMIWIS